MAQTKASQRGNSEWQDKTRKKIQTTLLVETLMKHVVSEEPLMSATQVTAALGLMKKTLPDLQSTELSGIDGSPLVPVINVTEKDA